MVAGSSWVVAVFMSTGAGAQPAASMTPALAASIIARDPRFAVASVLALANPDQSIRAGVREGLWVQEGFGNIALSETGRRYFSEVHALPAYGVVLVEPARREIVDVTNIVEQNGSTGSEVTFRWRYIGLPPLTARYTGQGGSPHLSKAVLRYAPGAGWRIEELALTESARVRFGGPSAATVRNEVAGTERFLGRLQQSTRPGRRLGTFTWPDHKVAITDTGFSLEESGVERCYWFGQVDLIQLESPPGRARGARRAIVVLRRDSVRPIAIEASEGQLGQFAELVKAIIAANRGWSTTYADVARRLKSAGQNNFVNLARQGRPRWYDEDEKTVTCDKGLMVRNAAELPAGLTVGSTWVGAIVSGAGTQISLVAELRISSPSSATITYNGVREALEVQLGDDGEIVLQGMSYEILSGGERVFQLDSFSGRVSADRRSIEGTWRDAGTGGGRWSVALTDR
jgi:hypothetical protein